MNVLWSLSPSRWNASRSDFDHLPDDGMGESDDDIVDQSIMDLTVSDSDFTIVDQANGHHQHDEVRKVMQVL